MGLRSKISKDLSRRSRSQSGSPLMRDISSTTSREMPVRARSWPWSSSTTGLGQVIANYYGITHESLGNYIAMASGQASNPQTQADCMFYSEFVPGTIGADEQAIGSGCVYPHPVTTIANQLEAKGLTWKGYMED